MKKVMLPMLCAALFAGCTGSLKKENEALKAEIQERREALAAHQQSSLEATQKELQQTDSLLTAVKARHDELHVWVMEHSTQMDDLSPEVVQLNALRAELDSLQVRFEVLCETIKYIHKKQKE